MQDIPFLLISSAMPSISFVGAIGGKQMVQPMLMSHAKWAFSRNYAGHVHLATYPQPIFDVLDGDWGL